MSVQSYNSVKLRFENVSDPHQRRYSAVGRHGRCKNKQYDRFRASKEVLKEVRKTAAGNLTSKLNTQGAVIRYVWSEVLQSSKNAWFAVQGNLSRNLHNFTVRYLNNTLPHLSNMFT